MSFFWGVGHGPDFGTFDEHPPHADSAAERAMSDVQELQDRLDRLALICMGLWELLKERTDLTEEELLEKVRQLDLMDGREDGKVRRKVQRCQKCERVMSRRHKRCLYCGAYNLAAGAFDAAL